jgi:hypothetical protein
MADPSRLWVKRVGLTMRRSLPIFPCRLNRSTQHRRYRKRDVLPSGSGLMSMIRTTKRAPNCSGKVNEHLSLAILPACAFSRGPTPRSTLSWPTRRVINEHDQRRLVGSWRSRFIVSPKTGSEDRPWGRRSAGAAMEAWPTGGDEDRAVDADFVHRRHYLRVACRAEGGDGDWPALAEVECLDARSAFIAQPNHVCALDKSTLLMRFDEGKTAVALAQEVCRS